MRFASVRVHETMNVLSCVCGDLFEFLLLVVFFIRVFYFVLLEFSWFLNDVLYFWVPSEGISRLPPNI